MLPTNDLLCARVRHAAEREWWSTSVPGRTHNHERIVIRFGGLYRQFVPMPTRGGAAPGRYIAHVTPAALPTTAWNAVRRRYS